MKGLILLDRDGVINEMVANADHGTIDSPLHPSQVKLIDGVSQALKQLMQSGFGLAIVSNQPAAAKSKTTRENLEAVHDKILKELESYELKILSSHICYHRSEDNCSCRKPKTGLLEAAFKQNPNYDPTESWMIGDGVTDIQAGAKLGIKTAFIGSRKADVAQLFAEANVRPTIWVETLSVFVSHILKSTKS